ncbi:hypothetical protein ACSDQ9_11340 [Aestuariimicrobium soli]|uniref:hypothetical protein n=1 Tax=Aestuariimicrobium soli TaxID=2035834 RepID=UPI003EC11DFB
MSHSTPPDQAPVAPPTDDPHVWLVQFLAEAEAMERQADAAGRALAEIEATVENSFMRLTMTGGGTISRLVFRPSANAATAAQLTEVFAATHAEAGAEVTRRTLAVMAQLAGPDDPSLAAVRQAVPASVREEMDAQEGADRVEDERPDDDSAQDDSGHDDSGHDDSGHDDLGHDDEFDRDGDRR